MPQIKVFVITLITFDYHQFENLEGLFQTREKALAYYFEKEADYPLVQGREISEKYAEIKKDHFLIEEMEVQ